MADQDVTVETLEQGDIWFLYRPRVEEESPRSEADVQRLYCVLAPGGRERFRLLVLANKALPAIDDGGRRKHWGFVDMVRKDPKRIDDALDPTTYDTKTRGERHLPAARPAGEGIYRIVRHGDHTHLVYALELPRKPAEVQDAFNIEDEGNHIITIKNPKKGDPPQAGLRPREKADLPARLTERFRGRRFVPLDPPDFLDREGVEFVLAAAGKDIEDGLGIRLHPEEEDEASADVFRQLHLERDTHPTAPLFAGRWA